jgi:hypothetical protein
MIYIQETLMSSEGADILRFLAFGAVWLFSIALIIAILSFANADAKARHDDPGPNVIAFPQRETPASPSRSNWLKCFKSLAFFSTKRIK